MYENERETPRRRDVGIANWIGTLLLASVPVVNIILFIVWAITSKKPSKRNFCIAALILIALCVVLSLVGIAFWGDSIVSWLATVDSQQLLNIANP